MYLKLNIHLNQIKTIIFMRLEYLNFNYNIDNRAPSKFFYHFYSSVEEANRYFAILENIADSIMKGMKKTLRKNANERGIDSGYTYMNEDVMTSGFDCLSLGYTKPIDDANEATLIINHIDNSKERLLKIYNSILAIPDLELSEDARDSINTINHLKLNNKDVYS